MGYASNLENDLAIRKYLDKYLARAAVSKVEIERAGEKIKVFVTTARPGVVIGKKGAEIETLRKKLEEVALLGPLFSPASGPAQLLAWPAVQLEVQLYSYLLELSPWQCPTDCPVLPGVWLGLLKVEEGGARASWAGKY